MDRNQHVKEYLSYYAGLVKSPGFAVLLNGPWGIGKTFLIKEIVKSFEAKQLRYVYVSLYGLSSLAEIDDALLCALYPLLDNRMVQLGGRLAKVTARFFHLDPEIKVNDVLSKIQADIFIFDDLERCNIPINTVLGYINEFVEHEQRKVIVVANETEIKSSVEYIRIREKLIGKTFEILSVFEIALPTFIESITDSAAKIFLKSKNEIISETYHQSELNNLRVLQQSMWDFERFFAALDAKHRNSEAAMVELLRLLLALSFEIRAGRLNAGDLEQRQNSLSTLLMRPKNEDGPLSSVAESQSRYPEIKLDTSLLSDQTIIDFLIKGVIDREKIAVELDASSFFMEIADEPAWRTVWHVHQRTEDEFNNAFIEVERAFLSRDFVKTGEILHVFGIRLWLARINVLPKTNHEVIAECKTYIDDLYANKRLDFKVDGHGEMQLRFGGYGGLSINESESADYRNLMSYLLEKKRAAEVDNLPSLAAEILDAMIRAPEDFYRKINVTADGASEFYNIPILAEIDAHRFASSWLSLPPDGQRTIAIALRGRYDHETLKDGLRGEELWVRQVRDIMLTRSKEMSAISRYRITENIAYALDTTLPQAAANAAVS